MAPKKRSRDQSADGGSFMFINSSQDGINAKPDKEVRAFVMKSARNKKSWSTRPKGQGQPSQHDPTEQQESSSHNQVAVTHWQPILTVETSQSNIHTPLSEELTTASPSSYCGSDGSSNSLSNKRGPETPLTCYSDASSELDHREENPKSTKRRRTLPSRTLTSLTRSVKPPDALVVPIEAKLDHLLQTFLRTAALNLFPIDIHKSATAVVRSWFADSVQSTGGGAFIYAASMSSLLIYGQDVTKHKFRAVEEVNKSLSNRSTMVSDSTIAAVLMLLALEEAGLASSSLEGTARQQSISVNEAHARGLKLMLEQRGGLSAIYPNRCLQLCILLHSIAQCTSTFRPPYALITDADGKVEDYADIAKQSSHTYPLHSSPFDALEVDDNLQRIIFTAIVFIADLNAWYEERPISVDVIDLQKHSSLLMYRLYDWYQRDQICQPERLHIIIAPDRSICLALLIFLVNAGEQNFTTKSPRLLQAVMRLREAIQITAFDQWKRAPELFLWTMTMGALGAKGLAPSPTRKQEINFFTSHLKEATIRYFGRVPVTMNHLLEEMNKCLWIPWIFDQRAKRLWISRGICIPDGMERGYVSSDEDEDMVDDEYALGHATSTRFLNKQ